MKTWPFLLLLISMTTHANSNFGMWSTSCDNDGFSGFVNGMVASHLLCHSGTINRHSLNGALLS